tara:strand:- start:42 stop:1007 length:966 start_codon:yes stop_codon:yes gene_type:complete
MTPPIFSQFSSGGGGRSSGFGMGPMGGGGLYDFSYASFGGNNGRSQDGPSLSQARSGLTGGETSSWKNDTNFFNTSSGIQLWTVPTDGTYRIEAEGGRGGYTGYGGGYAARMRGDFTLTGGEIIRIVVGQHAPSNGHTHSGALGGGGGGSFVVRSPYNSNGSILVIAGGGGTGANNPWSRQAGDNANTGTSSNSGGGWGSASSGNGGTGSTTGAAGAGFFGDGNTPCGLGNSQAAQAFVDGARGGTGPRCWGGPTGYGGFGGGGGNNLAGGGGGGYSGGGSGEWSSQQRGGGGGSYNSGSNQSNSQSNRSGHGIVTVSFLG